MALLRKRCGFPTLAQKEPNFQKRDGETDSFFQIQDSSESHRVKILKFFKYLIFHKNLKLFILQENFVFHDKTKQHMCTDSGVYQCGRFNIKGHISKHGDAIHCKYTYSSGQRKASPTKLADK